MSISFPLGLLSASAAVSRGKNKSRRSMLLCYGLLLFTAEYE